MKYAHRNHVNTRKWQVPKEANHKLPSFSGSLTSHKCPGFCQFIDHDKPAKVVFIEHRSSRFEPCCYRTFGQEAVLKQSFWYNIVTRLDGYCRRQHSCDSENALQKITCQMQNMVKLLFVISSFIQWRKSLELLKIKTGWFPEICLD